MISTAVLLVFLLIATATDVRWRKIYNWTVYPGILLALVAGVLVSLLDSEEWFGFVRFSESALGFAACGGLMLVCYVFFAGGVGGGDVKLIAMIGAFTGIYSGLETLLWTFVLAGCVALISLIWRVGLVRLVTRCFRYALFWFRLGMFAPLTDEDREPLKTKLFLAPSALAAVLVVQSEVFR